MLEHCCLEGNTWDFTKLALITYRLRLSKINSILFVRVKSGNRSERCQILRTPVEYQSRLSEYAAIRCSVFNFWLNYPKACLGTFLGLSALAVAARTAIRIKTRHGLYVDDVFLFFGLTCMAVTTGLAYPVVSIMYLEEATLFEPGRYTVPQNDLPILLRDMQIIDVFGVFAWTAEFSVKMSLLLFFRLLVKRLPPLILYVRIVIGTTALVWATLVCEPFIACPHFGISMLSKSPYPCVVIALLLKILAP